MTRLTWRSISLILWQRPHGQHFTPNKSRVPQLLSQTDGMRRAGLQRDALSSQVIDALEGAQRRRPVVKKLTTWNMSDWKIARSAANHWARSGGRSSFYCVLNGAGEVIIEQKVSTTPDAMKKTFGKMARCRIALETGTHSPWVSRLLADLGHEVIVAHARKVRLIGESRRKDDRLDAQALARLARVDPQLLSPIQHRSAQAQADLSVIRARHALGAHGRRWSAQRRATRWWWMAPTACVTVRTW